MGVSANSDEHRGRCGGGVPGTAVFGTKGGLTGVLAENLERSDVAKALRARRTFATTGERLVGHVRTQSGYLQGDDLVVQAGESVALQYSFYGNTGFSSIEAWDASGRILCRDLQQEASQQATDQTQRKLRVRWGGARLYDRYREAVWQGSILVSGAAIARIETFGGITDDAESAVRIVSDTQVTFDSKTSGDFDGVDIFFADSRVPESISVTGSLGGYVKVGDSLKGNPHKPQPRFSLLASEKESAPIGGKQIQIQGGAELFVSVETLLDLPLPRRVEGEYQIVPPPGEEVGKDRAIYFVGREFSGGKVITSPVFVTYSS